MIRCGLIERACRGVYHVVNEGQGQHFVLAMVCARSPGSIVCLHSALRVHRIRSKEPGTEWLAIPYGSCAPRLPDVPLRILRFSATARSLRVGETEIDGVPAYITSPERTIADCFRLRRQAGAETGPAAFLDALGKGLVDIQELVRIESALPCRRLRALLEHYAENPFR